MIAGLAGRVAVVTGAGRGIGRTHALALAARGVKVVVNDSGAAIDGAQGSANAADGVVGEILAQGGDAVGATADVTDADQVAAMIEATLTRWGRIDILVNNAGILRDKTFSKMSLADFRAVIEVHLMGAVHCCRSVWEIMKAQRYGRIVMTTSSSGLYGNFGQSSYAAAKMAVIGLMNTLVLEGEKYGIRVNAIAPAANTRMTAGVIADLRALETLTPESISAGLLALCHEAAPNRTILCCGAGSYTIARIVETCGLVLAREDCTAERVVAGWADITANAGQSEPTTAGEQTERFVRSALLRGPIDTGGQIR